MDKSPSALEIQDAPTQHRRSIPFYAIVIWIVAICAGLSSLYCWTTLLLQPLEIIPESPAWTQNIPPIAQIVLAVLVSDTLIHMVDFKPHKLPNFLLHLVPMACLLSTGQTVFLVFNLIIAPTFRYSYEHSVGWFLLAVIETVLLIGAAASVIGIAWRGELAWTYWRSAMKGESSSYSDVESYSDSD